MSPDDELPEDDLPENDLTVVVADDHPIWRDAVECDLAAGGCTVVGVTGDGDKAVRVCAAGSGSG